MIAEGLEEKDKKEPDIAIRLSLEDKAKEEEMKQIHLARMKAWRNKKRLELSKALDEPIIMPEVEKLEYEKIRDENVKQLEEARLAFFSEMQMIIINTLIEINNSKGPSMYCEKIINQSIYHLNFREYGKSSLLKLLKIFISYFLTL